MQWGFVEVLSTKYGQKGCVKIVVLQYKFEK